MHLNTVKLQKKEINSFIFSGLRMALTYVENQIKTCVSADQTVQFIALMLENSENTFSDNLANSIKFALSE